MMGEIPEIANAQPVTVNDKALVKDFLRPPDTAGTRCRDSLHIDAVNRWRSPKGRAGAKQLLSTGETAWGFAHVGQQDNEHGAGAMATLQICF
jgi:hypothetical protein